MVFHKCRLCGGEALNQVKHKLDRGPFWRCQSCGLIMKDSLRLLTASEEKIRYEEHNNTIDCPGYVDFLRRLMDPLLEKVQPATCGLDYGSGPNPVMALLLQKEGFDIRIYDPFFADDRDALLSRYHFVTCCEVVEHFHEPADEFDRLFSLLEPGGWLGVMTSTCTSDKDFYEWHYVMDPTHVCFFSEATYQWLSNRYNYRLYRATKNVSLFQKPGSLDDQAQA